MIALRNNLINSLILSAKTNRRNKKKNLMIL